MADPIVVSVEIADAEYIREFEVDPSEPLVKLLQQVAKEEKIPLRKKSGHPLVWTAEGPDVREDHAGEWTELTRTQPLTRISSIVLERYGARSPLFTIRFHIPGAAESLNERREIEKREEIEAKMAQRAAERQAEKSAAIGDAEDEFLMAAPPEEVMTMRPEPETVLDTEGFGVAGAAVGAAVGVGALAAGAAVAAGAGLEGRIRRRGGEGDGAAKRGGAGKAGAGKSGAGRAGAGKSGGRAGAGKAGAGKSGGRAGAAKSGRSGSSGTKGKSGSKGGGPFAGTPLEGVPVWAVGAAAGGAVLLLGLMLVLFSGGDEPEPVPEPTPAPVVVGDIEVATPPPPPPKPEVVEEITPPPMEQFYSRNKLVSYQANEVSAQLTSFTKTNVQITYTAMHPSGGLSHTVALADRFAIKISDGGGNMNGRAFTAGVTPGKGTRVDLRYDGQRLTVRVGGKRAGSWSIPDPGGFPRWRLDLESGIEITGLRASAQVDE